MDERSEMFPEYINPRYARCLVPFPSAQVLCFSSLDSPLEVQYRRYVPVYFFLVDLIFFLLSHDIVDWPSCLNVNTIRERFLLVGLLESESYLGSRPTKQFERLFHMYLRL